MLGRGKLVDEYREFTREVLLRLDHRLEAQWEQLRIQREENREYFEALHARLDDLHAESLAQRKGLWKLIDRLDNGGAAPAG